MKSSDIEDEIARKTKEEAFERLSLLSFENAIKWEDQSELVSDFMEQEKWWELYFQAKHPLTFERLRQSHNRRLNALELVDFSTGVEKKKRKYKNLWRELLLLLHNDQNGMIVEDINATTQVSTHVADEFGIDVEFRVRVSTIITRGAAPSSNEYLEFLFLNLRHQEALCEEPMMATRIWTVSFQDACLVLVENAKTKYQELLWLRGETGEEQSSCDVSLWAINHNNMMDSNPESFMEPPFLHGDATLQGPQSVFLCSTEGRKGVGNACATVIVRQRDILTFDKVLSPCYNTTRRHWRQLVTHERQSHSGIPVSAACYVLDSLLLVATHDGILRAHPRNNLHSTYHVEEFHSLVSQMTGLYNVVAIIHSYHILEVRHVMKQSADPFLRFGIAYSTTNADCNYSPLLYGPYVIYRGLDGIWYRVLYDKPGSSAQPQKEEIKLPHRAGWKIVSIKNANWSRWTIVLQNPETKHLVDVLCHFQMH